MSSHVLIIYNNNYILFDQILWFIMWFICCYINTTTFILDNIDSKKNNRQQHKNKPKNSLRTSACAQNESLWILWISATAIVRL